MQHCPHYSLALHTTDNDENDALVYRARCKRWSCDYCAEINRKVWRARLMLEVEKQPGLLWHFWTLTLDGIDHEGNTANSLQRWRQSWDNLLKRVRRDLGKMRYVRIFETHADGTLHVHMLCDKTYADVEQIHELDGRDNYRSLTLKGHLQALALGWRHDLRPIVTTDAENDGNERNVSAYCVKYLTKDIQSAVRQELKNAGMERVRMIQTSQGWADVPTSANPRAWEKGSITFRQFDDMSQEGIVAVDVDTKRTIKTGDFYGQGIYPNKIVDLLNIADEVQASVDKKINLG